MIQIIRDIDRDIDRCRNIVMQNNYLEIVIAIEELTDKYKNNISELLNNENQVVWNYSKKNLQEIERYLISYKENILKEEKEKEICEKISSLQLYLQKNDLMNKEEIIKEVSNIEDVSKEELGIDDKWNKLKNSLQLIKNLDVNIASYILEIIVLIIK